MKLLSLRNGAPLFVLVAILEGLYPIFAHTGSSFFPPIAYLSLGSALAAIILGIALVVTHVSFAVTWKQFGQITFITAGTSGYFLVGFLASPHTSAINTAILVQTEMLFTFLITVLFFGERLTLTHATGALSVFLGTLFVLLNGFSSFNPADFIILAGVWYLPFVNTVAKRIVEQVPPILALFWRSVLAAFSYGLISIMRGELQTLPAITAEFVVVLVLFASLILVCSKLSWYLGLRLSPVGRATYIVSARPAFGLLFAILLLSEIPTLYQLLGCALTVGGVLLMFRKA